MRVHGKIDGLEKQGQLQRPKSRNSQTCNLQVSICNMMCLLARALCQCACGIMRAQIVFFIASPFELRKPHLNWWSAVFGLGPEDR